MKTIARQATVETDMRSYPWSFNADVASECGFRFAIAQTAFNSTTSILIDAWVPHKFLTMLAEMVGRVGIEPTTN
jgi:hypothetical protein